MRTDTATQHSAADIKARLRLLEMERASAGLAGLAELELYGGDLRQEIAQTRAAYVGVAVTEIALLRAALSGRLEG